MSNLLDRQLDEHTGDLWGLLGSDEAVDVVVDEMSNLVLEVWILLDDGRKDLGGGNLVLLSDWHVLVDSNLWGTWHWGGDVWHWWGLWHTWIGHVWLLRSLWHSSWWDWLSWHWLAWHLLHLLLHVVLLVLVVVLLSLLMVVVLAHSSLWSTTSTHVVHLVSTGLVHLLVHSLILLNKSQELLDDLGEMWLTGEVIPLEATGLLCLVLLEVGFVLGLLELDLSELLDLVVVDD